MTPRRQRRVGVLVFVLWAISAPLAAQDQPQVKIPDLAPDVALRPFFLVTEQRFRAAQTFEAVFGTAVQPFLGGGVQLAFSNGLYADVAFSRFSKSGARAFLQGGEAFSLGIPLKATITPLEVTGGFRFGAEWSSLVIPYVGAGFGTYKYTETADFAVAGDDIDVRRSGYLIVGGAEFRVHRWIVAAADVQFTQISGILGEAGVSQQAGENNLGGIAARFRVMIGR
jgi:hypothetical protein